MPDSHWLEFLRTLPLELPVIGQIIQLREREDGQLGVRVLPDPNPLEPFKDCPAGVVFLGTPSFRLSKDEVLGFLAHYLKTPFGPRLLTMGSKEAVNKQRRHLFRAAMLSWVELNGPKDKDGRLAKAVTCIHFITEQTKSEFRIGRCSKQTKDPSGLCHYHNKPGVPTLLNEGVLKYIETVEGSEAYWIAKSEEASRKANEQERAVRQKRHEAMDAERQRREDKWKATAAAIRYTATDRQIYLLLDLGVSAHELQGITKEAASAMIDSTLDKVHSSP